MGGISWKGLARSFVVTDGQEYFILNNPSNIINNALIKHKIINYGALCI